MASHQHQSNARKFSAVLDENKVQEGMLRASLAQTPPRSSKQKNWHPFPGNLAQEVVRITEFVNRQQQGLEYSAKALFVRAVALAAKDVEQHNIQGLTAELYNEKATIRNITEDTIALQEFVTSSRKILLRVASMADGHLGFPDSAVDMVQDAVKVSLNSALICVISDIYNSLRQTEEKIVNRSNGGGEAMWEAPSSFKRTTTKYWVKDECLTKLMIVCSREAPLLVYGKKGALTSADPNHINVSEGDKLWETLATKVNSIYFDSDDMDLYRERIKRSEGAQLLRVRWYGTEMPKGEGVLFLEMKTHHEKWVAQKSIKERAEIQERDMAEFLRPVPWETPDIARAMVLAAKPKLQKDADKLTTQTDLLHRMHNLCVKNRLNPCVRTVYDRAAFQSASSNGKSTCPLCR